MKRCMHLGEIPFSDIKDIAKYKSPVCRDEPPAKRRFPVVYRECQGIKYCFIDDEESKVLDDKPLDAPILVGDYGINLKEYMTHKSGGTVENVPVWKRHSTYWTAYRKSDLDKLRFVTLIDYPQVEHKVSDEMKCEEWMRLRVKVNKKDWEATPLIQWPKRREFDAACKLMKSMQNNEDVTEIFDSSLENSKENGIVSIVVDDSDIGESPPANMTESFDDNLDAKEEFEDYVLAIVKSSQQIPLSPQDRNSLSKIENHPRHMAAMRALKGQIKETNIHDLCKIYTSLTNDSQYDINGFQMDCMSCGGESNASAVIIFDNPHFFDVEEGITRPHNADTPYKQSEACAVCWDCVDPVKSLHFLYHLKVALFKKAAHKAAVVRLKRFSVVDLDTLSSEIATLPGWTDDLHQNLIHIWGSNA